MKDENAPRNAWRWANEDEAFPSTDGHVRGIGLAMMAASGLDEKDNESVKISFYKDQSTSWSLSSEETRNQTCVAKPVSSL